MHMDPKFSMAIHLTDVYTSKKKRKTCERNTAGRYFVT
jgi:hypothetical protein